MLIFTHRIRYISRDVIQLYENCYSYYYNSTTTNTTTTTTNNNNSFLIKSILLLKVSCLRTDANLDRNKRLFALNTLRCFDFNTAIIDTSDLHCQQQVTLNKSSETNVMLLANCICAIPSPLAHPSTVFCQVINPQTKVLKELTFVLLGS